jgi:antirestriction protein ArdC
MKNKVYEIITERIIDMLKKGVAPWHQPWKVTCLGNECGAFFNLKSKKPYRGVNVLLLSGNPYSSPYFVTFKQAKDMGGMVRKGEQGFPVTFWKRIEIEEDLGGETVKKTIPFLRYYTVFNVEQCDGLEDKLPKTEEREATEEEKEQVKSEALNEADNIVESMPKRPEILHGGSRACYKPHYDVVKMPEPTTFKDLEHYYSTLFHELVHATGHKLPSVLPTTRRKNWLPRWARRSSAVTWGLRTTRLTTAPATCRSGRANCPTIPSFSFSPHLPLRRLLTSYLARHMVARKIARPLIKQKGKTMTDRY